MSAESFLVSVVAAVPVEVEVEVEAAAAEVEDEEVEELVEPPPEVVVAAPPPLEPLPEPPAGLIAGPELELELQSG
jgi:ribosomal protein L12E/L44/L45/RPP1/RPP2